jgi:hypothetical protein
MYVYVHKDTRHTRVYESSSLAATYTHAHTCKTYIRTCTHIHMYNVYQVPLAPLTHTHTHTHTRKMYIHTCTTYTHTQGVSSSFGAIFSHVQNVHIYMHTYTHIQGVSSSLGAVFSALFMLRIPSLAVAASHGKIDQITATRCAFYSAATLALLSAG